MSERQASPQDEQALSALMDGEIDAPGAARLAQAWRSDALLRESWHRWHLVGDVMRSQDLATAPGHDEDFLQGLRQRLAQEPVLVAPTPPVASGVAAALPGEAAAMATAGPQRRSRRAWAASALAASVAAVAGGLVLLQPQAPSPPLQLAERGAALPVAALAPAAVEPAAVGADGQLLRDARLDRYLVAHKQWGGSMAAPVMVTRTTAGAR